MVTELRVPPMGESIDEGILAQWHKQVGEEFAAGDVLLEIETDKVTMEVPAPFSGKLISMKVQKGEKVSPDQILASLEEQDNNRQSAGSIDPPQNNPAMSPSPLHPEAVIDSPAENKTHPDGTTVPPPETSPSPLSPSVRKLAQAKNIRAEALHGSGRHGQVLKEDLQHYMAEAGVEVNRTPGPVSEAGTGITEETDNIRVVPMSPLRKRVAQRMLEAQQNAAILTTFNEVDMSAVMNLREKYKESFRLKHGVNPGMVSFFATAVIHAVRQYPELNGRIDGENIVYSDDVNLGVAVGGDKGLVVPVIKGAQRLTFGQLEQEVHRLAGLVHDQRIQLNDLEGGTFTITNGGIYGSLLSTPILNPPQSGILGLHKIEKRPVVFQDSIVIRPMMYVALSYDHRLVDGKGAVGFLVRIKELVEDPGRLLMDV